MYWMYFQVLYMFKVLWKIANASLDNILWTKSKYIVNVRKNLWNVKKSENFYLYSANQNYLIETRPLVAITRNKWIQNFTLNDTK